ICRYHGRCTVLRYVRQPSARAAPPEFYYRNAFAEPSWRAVRPAVFQQFRLRGRSEQCLAPADKQEPVVQLRRFVPARRKLLGLFAACKSAESSDARFCECACRFFSRDRDFASLVEHAAQARGLQPAFFGAIKDPFAAGIRAKY